jgi:hypothetical protein
VLLLHAIVVSAILFLAWRNRKKLSGNLFWPVLFLALCSATLLVLAHIAHFRILGRHFAPLIVAILFFLGFGIAESFSGAKILKIFGVLFIALNIVSCFSLRFSARHRKDNYRVAAEIAFNELAIGKTVWWNAALSGANFYHLSTRDHDTSSAARYFMNPSADELRAAKMPDVIIVSKPDVYDQSGAISNFVAENHFEKMTNLSAFTIWHSP